MSGVRFAPSPTGTFHLGNLRTAWISWRWAQELRLPWCVRVEDIDTERVRHEFRESQLNDMKSLGMCPDQLQTQSDSRSLHLEWFLKAVREGLVYPCDCSRKDVQAALRDSVSAPHGILPVYSGKCRNRDPMREPLSGEISSWAWRFRVDSDAVQTQGQSDFIIGRSLPSTDQVDLNQSFVPAYYWACAIDDHVGRYDLLVRAWDLASSAPLQRLIQAWLCRSDTLADEIAPRFPAVFHTALIVQNLGLRLEKRTQGVTLAELARRGFGTERLLDAFERSFDKTLFQSVPCNGDLFGEKSQSLSLRDLGVPDP